MVEATTALEDLITVPSTKPKYLLAQCKGDPGRSHSRALLQGPRLLLLSLSLASSSPWDCGTHLEKYRKGEEEKRGMEVMGEILMRSPTLTWLFWLKETSQIFRRVTQPTISQSCHQMELIVWRLWTFLAAWLGQHCGSFLDELSSASLTALHRKCPSRLDAVLAVGTQGWSFRNFRFLPMWLHMSGRDELKLATWNEFLQWPPWSKRGCPGAGISAEQKWYF